MAAIKLTKQAARLWADPATRARIVAMHATETPLVDMVHELGLDDSLDADQLRGVVENLSGEEVAAIRKAFIDEARAADGDGAAFPIDCRVDDPSAGVRVTPSTAGVAVAPVTKS